MNRFVLLLLFTANISVAQDKHLFKYENGLIWQKTYDKSITASTAARHLSQMGAEITYQDSTTVTAKTDLTEPKYETSGLAIYARSAMRYTVTVEIKPDRYRATATNFKKKGSEVSIYGATDATEDDLSEYIIKRKNEFRTARRHRRFYNRYSEYLEEKLNIKTDDW